MVDSTPTTGPVSAQNFALAGGWVSGGMATVQADGKILALNEPLRDWFLSQDAKARDWTDFWSELWALYPDWRQPITEAWETPDTYRRLELAASNGQSVEVELARHDALVTLRIDSILPPVAELEEGSAEDFLRTDSARRQSYIRLLRAEGQLNNLIRRWPGVIFSQRADLSFHFISDKIEELTGVPVDEWKRLPQRFWQVVHEGDVDDVRHQLRRASGVAPDGPCVFRLRNLKTGRVSYVAEHRQAVRTQRGLLLGYDGVWLDVTRQNIAEKRLSTAAWKDTLSVLTMGLAHDFSNIIAGIHSLSEAYQAEISPDHPFQEGLKLIKGNSMQASQLVHRILQLHHGKIGEKNYHNLNELVREILDLVRKIVPRHIRIDSVVGTESLPVYADSIEFRQVLINLARNAVDAMPQGGALRFEVSRHDTFPPLMHVEGVLPRLPSLCISTEDTGCGIPAQHLNSIFDPFFTTKSVEKGSGLGLYNARLFAEKHHGAISVDSIEKKGTCVRVWLPEADFTEGERNELEPAPKRRTLLVFGPSGDALDSMADFLRRSGQSVVLASPPQNAARLLEGQDYSLAGVLLLAQGADRAYTELASAVRRTGLPIKVIVQATGCNQDELDSELTGQADLVLPADMTRVAMTTSINSLFAHDP